MSALMGAGDLRAGLLVHRDGFFFLADAVEFIAEHEEVVGVFGVGSDGLAQLGDARLVVAAVAQLAGRGAVGLGGLGIAADGFFNTNHRVQRIMRHPMHPQ